MENPPEPRETENRLKLRLEEGGFTSPKAVPVFLAIKAGTMASGALIGAAYGFIAGGRTLIITVFGGCVGFYLPELVLALRIKGWVGGTLMLLVPTVLFCAVYSWKPEYVELLLNEGAVRILIAGAVLLHLLGAAVRKVMTSKPSPGDS